jgi:hypothetical protein
MPKNVWKSDLFFRVTSQDIIRSWRTVACQEAVMLPLKLVRRGRSLAEMLHIMQQRQRARLVALHEAGFHPRKKTNQKPSDSSTDWVEYGRNCPPFGIKPSAFVSASIDGPRRAHPCHRVRFCPSCWAREVVRESFVHFEYAFNLIGRKNLDGLQLVAVRRPLIISDGLFRSGSAIAAARSGFADFRPRFLLGSRSRLAYDVIGEDLFSCTCCTLSLVPQTVRLPSGDGREVRKAALGDENQDDRSLAKMLGWCFSYPPGLMYGDAATQAHLMWRLFDVCTATSTGLAENNNFRSLISQARLTSASHVSEPAEVHAEVHAEVVEEQVEQ